MVAYLIEWAFSTAQQLMYPSFTLDIGVDAPSSSSSLYKNKGRATVIATTPA